MEADENEGHGVDERPLAPPDDPAGVLGEEASTALRAPAVRRLLALRTERRLTRKHLAGEGLEVTERTVWRWLAEASRSLRDAIRPGERSGDRFEITGEIRVLLAYWHGNAIAVHRQLVARAETGGRDGQPTTTAESTALPAGAPPAVVPLLGPVPSLSTFLRAVRRDLTAGEWAGLAAGPDAARAYDVFGKRAVSWRNQVWEAGHVQVPVLVVVDGDLVRPWVTWFIDCATNAVTGVAVTPGDPSRESVLVALRSAVLCEEPYGLFGGVPEQVRVDRGKEFLSRTVTAAFDLLDVTVEDLPAYSPRLKGAVEGLNRAVEGMFLAALPGYARQPRPGKRASRPKDEVLLGLEEFTTQLLAWTLWWNTEHCPALLRPAGWRPGVILRPRLVRFAVRHAHSDEPSF
ncbi:hypothetical protein AB0B21_32925 [Streptomyces rimosus]|uniref:transposase family protein n=1 Tax=Streptomyces rimosus TaxID=1927 RepID=UPI001F44BDEC|nr:transposase family protein [Streptomyces rimosus]